MTTSPHQFDYFSVFLSEEQNSFTMIEPIPLICGYTIEAGQQHKNPPSSVSIAPQSKRLPVNRRENMVKSSDII